MGDEPGPVRSGAELPWDDIASYVRQHIDDVEGPMEVGQFTAGAANLTYLLRFGGVELVLRRPPFGRIPPGAHDMVREHRVLSQLWRHFRPAPRAWLLCRDHSVAGADFVVMERRRGEVIRDHVPESMARHDDVVSRVCVAVVDSMAQLHLLNPDKVGLGELGRPEGFVERQLGGWRRRWELAITDDTATNAMTRVHERLARDVPNAQRVSILHNDLRVDNCQFRPDDPDRVAAMFDWDMATLGDPLVDLATMLSYWPEPTDPPTRRRGVAGFGKLRPPSREEVTHRYAEASGLDLERVKWYEAFALWKTGVVYQQIYQRYAAGKSTDSRAVVMAERVPALADEALELLG
jgi:aminoglycoside phosphotransferase (APT) family kinase protein